MDLETLDEENPAEHNLNEDLDSGNATLGVPNEEDNPLRASQEPPQGVHIEQRKEIGRPLRRVRRVQGVPQSIVGRRAKISLQQPYTRLRRYRISSAKGMATEWYALASPGPLLSPPDSTITIEAMQLFFHVDTSIVPDFIHYDGNDFDRFITIWIWASTGRWEVIEAGSSRMIDGREYLLKINNCLEPSWVLRR
ncbi:hypothetical protein PM082_022735 [Marasmius tenuissimus]|nr:hypothetical protein PM082_022735 [Marasmius tenuissimus]